MSALLSFEECKIAATCILKNFVRKFAILNFDLITTLQVTTVVKRIGKKTEETIYHYLHSIETKLRLVKKNKIRVTTIPFLQSAWGSKKESDTTADLQANICVSNV